MISIRPSHLILLPPLPFSAGGRLISGKSEYDRSIGDLDQAIKLLPGYSAAYTSRGAAFINKGDYVRALEDLGEAVRLDPRCTLGFYYREIAYDLGGERRAVADYARAIELNPNPTGPDAFALRGDAYLRKHEYDRAIQDFPGAQA